MKETNPWYKIRNVLGTSLTVQRLEEYHASTARDQGSIPGQGPKIPHATWHSQGEKKKRCPEYKDICALWSVL